MPIPNKAEVSTYFYDAGVLRALTVTRDGRVVPKVPTEAELRKVNLRYYLDQGFIQRPRDLVNFCPNRKNLVNCSVVYFTTEEFVLTNKYWSAGVQYATTEVTILKYGGVEPLIKVVPAAPLGTMLFDLQNFRDRMQENPTTIPANHYFIVIARGKGVLEFAGVRNQLPQSSPPPDCRRANVTPQSASPHPVFAADVRVPPPSRSPASQPFPGLVAPTRTLPPPVPREQISVAGPSGSGQFAGVRNQLPQSSPPPPNPECRRANVTRQSASPHPVFAANVRVPPPSRSPASEPSPSLVAPTRTPQEQVSVAGPSGAGQFASDPSRTGPATASATSSNVEQRLTNLERDFAEVKEMLSRNLRSERLVFGASERSDQVYMDKFVAVFTPRSEQHFSNQQWD